MSARQQNGTAAQNALASLCSAYWYPLYAYVRGRGKSPHDAEDLTQEFPAFSGEELFAQREPRQRQVSLFSVSQPEPFLGQ